MPLSKHIYLFVFNAGKSFLYGLIATGKHFRGEGKLECLEEKPPTPPDPVDWTLYIVGRGRTVSLVRFTLVLICLCVPYMGKQREECLSL